MTDKTAKANTEANAEPITIKKYANRRLYNTSTSTYVTLENLAQMVKDGILFNVYDAKTGEDITRSVLTLIIMEAETKGQNLLPTSFLRQVIGFHGANMDALLGKYLEQSMQTFAQNKDKMKDMLQTMTGGIFPVSKLEEMGKQNLSMFERTFKMFSPFGDVRDTKDEANVSGAQAAVKRMREGSERSLEELQNQLDRLQSQIDGIKRKR